MPAKKDVKWLARWLKKEPGNDPTEDRTARHSELGGARSSHGSFDRGQSRHEGADTEEGAEQAALFHMRRKIGRGKGRESGRRRPRARVESRGIGSRAKTPDIRESSLGGAKSVKERMLSTNTTKRVGGRERVIERHYEKGSPRLVLRLG